MSKPAQWAVSACYKIFAEGASSNKSEGFFLDRSQELIDHPEV